MALEIVLLPMNFPPLRSSPLHAWRPPQSQELQHTLQRSPQFCPRRSMQRQESQHREVCESSDEISFAATVVVWTRNTGGVERSGGDESRVAIVGVGVVVG